DPQVKARGMRMELPHPQAGTAPTVANPLRLSATPVEYRNAPPLLGQHTHEVLQQLLGLTSERIGALASRGII
ncbi:MAG: CoA transferase, partial [Bacillota bacterium]